jgi:hypothetical protein
MRCVSADNTVNERHSPFACGDAVYCRECGKMLVEAECQE